MNNQPNTARRTRRTAPTAQRRKQLIEAAIAIIAENGLSGTTTGEVTRRAQLSMGLLHHHFNSKDGLFAAVLLHLADEMRAAWRPICEDRELPPETRLTAIIEALFHPDLCTRNKIAVWFAFFGDAGHRATYRETVESYDDERSRAIEALCAELAETTGCTHVDAHAVAQGVEAMADGLWLSMMLYPAWVGPEAARARVLEWLSGHFPSHFAGSPHAGEQS